MSLPRSFLCSDIKLAPDDSLRNGRRVVALSAQGNNPNINVRIENRLDGSQKETGPAVSRSRIGLSVVISAGSDFLSQPRQTRFGPGLSAPSRGVYCGASSPCGVLLVQDPSLAGP